MLIAIAKVTASPHPQFPFRRRIFFTQLLKDWIAKSGTGDIDIAMRTSKNFADVACFLPIRLKIRQLVRLILELLEDCCRQASQKILWHDILLLLELSKQCGGTAVIQHAGVTRLRILAVRGNCYRFQIDPVLEDKLLN